MRLFGVADEAHHAVEAILDPCDRIVEFAIHVAIERVEREIAPLRIAGPVVAEANHRMAAIGLDVLAQCRHFRDALADLQRNRPVLDAGWINRNARLAGAPHHLVGPQFSGEIHFLGLARMLGQRIAHRAAHGARLARLAIEQGKHALRRRIAQPGRFSQALQRLRDHHGTSSFSTRS